MVHNLDALLGSLHVHVTEGICFCLKAQAPAWIAIRGAASRVLQRVAKEIGSAQICAEATPCVPLTPLLAATVPATCVP